MAISVVKFSSSYTCISWPRSSSDRIWVFTKPVPIFSSSSLSFHHFFDLLPIISCPLHTTPKSLPPSYSWTFSRSSWSLFSLFILWCIHTIGNSSFLFHPACSPASSHSSYLHSLTLFILPFIALRNFVFLAYNLTPLSFGHSPWAILFWLHTAPLAHSMIGTSWSLLFPVSSYSMTNVSHFGKYFYPLLPLQNFCKILPSSLTSVPR